MSENVYAELSAHLAKMAMGPEDNEFMVEIIRKNFSESEAKILLALPAEVKPLKAASVAEISASSGLPTEEIQPVLKDLAERWLIHDAPIEPGGETGYSLLQYGYGLPQSFFWHDDDSDHIRDMALLFRKHSNKDALVNVFGGAQSKPWRWIPIEESVEPDLQAVVPFASIERIVNATSKIALVNCPCRVIAHRNGRPECPYPLDVCVKYDEMAEYVIGKGIGREITKEECLAVHARAEEAGLVHFSDNIVEGEVKHTCNCCPCCCWSLGNLSRHRIPRDLLMACQFIRETDEDNCIGCGDCVDACPMKCIVMDGHTPIVDMEWCIGCGLCARPCPSEAIKMRRRDDIADPFPSFDELMQTRLDEKAKAK